MDISLVFDDYYLEQMFSKYGFSICSTLLVSLRLRYQLSECQRLDSTITADELDPDQHSSWDEL